MVESGDRCRGRRTPTRTLVIPTYRESARIGPTIRTLAGGPLDSPCTEILVVDDGSDDDTVAQVGRVADDSGCAVRILRLGSNRGKGAAVRTGVLAAHGRTVVFTDADLSTPVPDIVRCFEHVESGEADVSYATRAHEQSEIADRAPAFRAVFGRTFNRLLRGLGLTSSLDTQCGLKGFRGDVGRALFAAVRSNGFAFDVEVLARAERAGLTVAPLPVRWSHVEASRVRPVRDAFAMTADVLRIRWLLLSAPRSIPVAEGRDPADGPGQMSRADVEALAEDEDDHWWFSAKRRLVLDVLGESGGTRLAVDIGAGGGALLTDLAARGWRAFGTDSSPVAARQSRDRSGRPVLQTDAESLALRDASIDMITSLDVVEHLDDDVAALRGYRAALRPGGRLVLTVPAYLWAWSNHDVRLGHRRRYTVRRLREVLESADLHPVRVTYFHGWLVPLAAVVRKTPLGRLVGDQESAGAGPSRLAPVLEGLAAAERRILRRTGLPFGLSVIAVARRPTA